MKIVDSSECSKETKQAGRADDDLIVCAERVQEGPSMVQNGPGKVHQDANLYLFHPLICQEYQIESRERK